MPPWASSGNLNLADDLSRVTNAFPTGARENPDDLRSNGNEYSLCLHLNRAADGGIRCDEIDYDARALCELEVGREISRPRCLRSTACDEAQENKQGRKA